MSIVSSGVYEVRLYQDLYSQEVLNVFHYFRGGGDNDGASELAIAFLASHVPAIALTLSSNLTFTRLEVESVLGIDVPHVLTIVGLIGAINSAAAPAQYVMPYKYNRTDKSTRNGSKRFSGVPKADLDGNDLSAAQMALNNTLSQTLESNIPSTTQDFVPIIMRKPATPGQTNRTINVVDSVSALDRAGTQRTRLPY